MEFCLDVFKHDFDRNHENTVLTDLFGVGGSDNEMSGEGGDSDIHSLALSKCAYHST